MKKQKVIGLLLCVQSGLIFAQNLTPETYVRVDVEARQLTIDGMHQQVDMLSGDVMIDTINSVSESNRDKVNTMFNYYGTTASAHSAYGTRYGKEIEQWLAGHSDWEQTYDALDDEFSSLSQQLSTLREGQP